MTTSMFAASFLILFVICVVVFMMLVTLRGISDSIIQYLSGINARLMFLIPPSKSPGPSVSPGRPPNLWLSAEASSDMQSVLDKYGSGPVHFHGGYISHITDDSGYKRYFINFASVEVPSDKTK